MTTIPRQNRQTALAIVRYTIFVQQYATVWTSGASWLQRYALRRGEAPAEMLNGLTDHAPAKIFL